MIDFQSHWHYSGFAVLKEKHVPKVLRCGCYYMFNYLGFFHLLVCPTYQSGKILKN